MGCLGISCRGKIEVVERPPPVPLRPCGPPPQYDGGGLRFLSRQRLDRQQIIEPQGSNRLRPTFPRTALPTKGTVESRPSTDFTGRKSTKASPQLSSIAPVFPHQHRQLNSTSCMAPRLSRSSLRISPCTRRFD